MTRIRAEASIVGPFSPDFVTLLLERGAVEHRIAMGAAGADALAAIERRIMETPAGTLGDVLVKAQCQGQPAMILAAMRRDLGALLGMPDFAG